MRSSASYISVGFGFLSHVGRLGRQRKTSETINVNRREALVQLIGCRSCMARRLRDGWLTWRKRQWTREANSERRPWTRPFSSYLRPVLHHPSSHCVDDDSEFLCVSLEKAFARWTGEVVVDVVLDDSGRREGTCDRSFGSRFPSDYEHAHTYCSPRLDTYATKALPL